MSNFHMLGDSLLRGDGETALFGPHFCDLLFFILQQHEFKKVVRNNGWSVIVCTSGSTC
jgi:hypothetical protein